MCGTAMAQDAAWHLYTSDGGLPETRVYGVTLGPSGRVWTLHGAPFAADYDGYRARQIPVNATETTLAEGPEGTVWTSRGRMNERIRVGVQRLDGDRWHAYTIPEPGNATLAEVRVFAWQPGGVLVFTRQRRIEFDAAANRSTVVGTAEGLGSLRDVHGGPDASVWIATARALADLFRTGPASASETAGPGGHELASRLRHRQQGLAVLLMSGFTDDPAVRETSDVRTSFLQKACTPAARARERQQLLGCRA